jgi:hypothetical protein
MRTTLDLPDDILMEAKILAVTRGLTLRELMLEALRRLLDQEDSSRRKRMTEAPIKLPGHTIPIRSNMEMAQLFEQEDVMHLNEVYR